MIKIREDILSFLNIYFKKAKYYKKYNMDKIIFDYRINEQYISSKYFSKDHFLLRSLVS